MRTKHSSKGASLKTVQTIITYFHNNRFRMRYNEYLAAGYPIGSGVAEGTVAIWSRIAWNERACAGPCKGHRPSSI